MALQTSTGYVRLSMSTGMDETTLTVNWLTFHSANWRENNPQRRWAGISENGMITFDLTIKEKQIVNIVEDEAGNVISSEEQDVIIGYLPQSMETAHELLRNHSGKDCNFKSVNFQVV